MTFGATNPQNLSGLSPTFLAFVRMTDGQTLTPPSVTELAGQGLYSFQYGTTQPIAFICDGFTTLLGLGRYVVGQIDPSDRADEYGTTIVAMNTNTGTSLTAAGVTVVAIGNSLTTKLTNMGTTLVAIGNTVGNIGGSLSVTVSGIGSTASTLGDNVTPPGDLFGYLMRIDALLEGQSQFLKGAGILTYFDKTGATTLSVRTLTNNISLVTKI